MELQAIQEIKNSATAQMINDFVSGCTDTHQMAPLLCVPKDHDLINLEQYEQNRSRFRGIFKTPSLAAFVGYCKIRKQGDVFIDREYMKAEAIFNRGDENDPGHCDDKATLQLKKTPAFIALLELAENGMVSQRYFAEWLEDFANHIEPISADGETYSIKEAINAVRNVTVEKAQAVKSVENNLSQKMSAMEEIEAKSEDFQLPAEFNFTCEPWTELQPRTFRARISVLTEGKIHFKVRLADISQDQEDMALELQSKIEQDTGDAATTYIGTFAP
jgi:uncharacterized protein YfdQ (DUF2303 family)